jgi:hypothetical protein
MKNLLTVFISVLFLQGIFAWTESGIWGDPTVYNNHNDGGGGGVGGFGEAPKGHCHGDECFSDKHHSHAFLNQIKGNLLVLQ